MGTYRFFDVYSGIEVILAIQQNGYRAIERQANGYVVDDNSFVSIGQRATNINGYPFVVVDSYDLVYGWLFSLVIYYGDEGVMMGGS